MPKLRKPDKKVNAPKLSETLPPWFTKKLSKLHPNFGDAEKWIDQEKKNLTMDIENDTMEDGLRNSIKKNLEKMVIEKKQKKKKIMREDPHEGVDIEKRDSIRDKNLGWVQTWNTTPALPYPPYTRQLIVLKNNCSLHHQNALHYIICLTPISGRQIFWLGLIVLIIFLARVRSGLCPFGLTRNCLRMCAIICGSLLLLSLLVEMILHYQVVKSNPSARIHPADNGEIDLYMGKISRHTRKMSTILMYPYKNWSVELGAITRKTFRVIHQLIETNENVLKSCAVDSEYFHVQTPFLAWFLKYELLHFVFSVIYWSVILIILSYNAMMKFSLRALFFGASICCFTSIGLVTKALVLADFCEHPKSLTDLVSRSYNLTPEATFLKSEYNRVCKAWFTNFELKLEHYEKQYLYAAREIWKYKASASSAEAKFISKMSTRVYTVAMREVPLLRQTLPPRCEFDFSKPASNIIYPTTAKTAVAEKDKERSRPPTTPVPTYDRDILGPIFLPPSDAIVRDLCRKDIFLRWIMAQVFLMVLAGTLIIARLLYHIITVKPGEKLVQKPRCEPQVYRTYPIEQVVVHPRKCSMARRCYGHHTTRKSSKPTGKPCKRSRTNWTHHSKAVSKRKPAIDSNSSLSKQRLRCFRSIRKKCMFSRQATKFSESSSAPCRIFTFPFSRSSNVFHCLSTNNNSTYVTSNVATHGNSSESPSVSEPRRISPSIGRHVLPIKLLQEKRSYQNIWAECSHSTIKDYEKKTSLLKKLQQQKHDPAAQSRSGCLSRNQCEQKRHKSCSKCNLQKDVGPINQPPTSILAIDSDLIRCYPQLFNSTSVHQPRSSLCSLHSSRSEFCSHLDKENKFNHKSQSKKRRWEERSPSFVLSYCYGSKASYSTCFNSSKQIKEKSYRFSASNNFSCISICSTSSKYCEKETNAHHAVQKDRCPTFILMCALCQVNHRNRCNFNMSPCLPCPQSWRNEKKTCQTFACGPQSHDKHSSLCHPFSRYNCLYKNTGCATFQPGGNLRRFCHPIPRCSTIKFGCAPFPRYCNKQSISCTLSKHRCSNKNTAHLNTCIQKLKSSSRNKCTPNTYKNIAPSCFSNKYNSVCAAKFKPVCNCKFNKTLSQCERNLMSKQLFRKCIPNRSISQVCKTRCVPAPDSYQLCRNISTSKIKLEPLCASNYSGKRVPCCKLPKLSKTGPKLRKLLRKLSATGLEKQDPRRSPQLFTPKPSRKANPPQRKKWKQKLQFRLPSSSSVELSNPCEPGAESKEIKSQNLSHTSNFKEEDLWWPSPSFQPEYKPWCTSSRSYTEILKAVCVSSFHENTYIQPLYLPFCISEVEQEVHSSYITGECEDKLCSSDTDFNSMYNYEDLLDESFHATVKPEPLDALPLLPSCNSKIQQEVQGSSIEGECEVILCFSDTEFPFMYNRKDPLDQLYHTAVKAESLESSPNLTKKYDSSVMSPTLIKTFVSSQHYLANRARSYVSVEKHQSPEISIGDLQSSSQTSLTKWLDCNVLPKPQRTERWHKCKSPKKTNYVCKKDSQEKLEEVQSPQSLSQTSLTKCFGSNILPQSQKRKRGLKSKLPWFGKANSKPQTLQTGYKSSCLKSHSFDMNLLSDPNITKQESQCTSTEFSVKKGNDSNRLCRLRKTKHKPDNLLSILKAKHAVRRFNFLRRTKN